MNAVYQDQSFRIVVSPISTVAEMKVRLCSSVHLECWSVELYHDNVVMDPNSKIQKYIEASTNKFAILEVKIRGIIVFTPHNFQMKMTHLMTQASVKRIVLLMTPPLKQWSMIVQTLLLERWRCHRTHFIRMQLVDIKRIPIRSSQQ